MQTIELISQIILLKIVGNGIPTQLTENVINYDDKQNYVFCRAMQDGNKNRLYVHEVFVADNLQNKGNTLQTAAFQPHGGIALYKSILANVLDAANVDITPDMAKEVPTSGEANGTRYSLRRHNRQPGQMDTRAAELYEQMLSGRWSQIDEVWHDDLLICAAV